MQEVSVVHLSTGSDVVGKVAFPDAYTVVITDPVTPLIAPTPNGQMSVQLMPARMFVKEGTPLEVSRAHVVYIAPVPPQLEQAYRELTSNIVIAPASSLSTLLKS